MVKIYVYMEDRIEKALRFIAEKEGISMSTTLRVAFIDKFSKFYPELFKVE